MRNKTDKKKNTKHWKTKNKIFTRIGRQCRLLYICNEQNIDQARLMHKIKLRSSFKEIIFHSYGCFFNHACHIDFRNYSNHILNKMRIYEMLLLESQRQHKAQRELKVGWWCKNALNKLFYESTPEYLT